MFIILYYEYYKITENDLDIKNFELALCDLEF